MEKRKRKELNLKEEKKNDLIKLRENKNKNNNYLPLFFSFQHKISYILTHVHVAILWTFSNYVGHLVARILVSTPIPLLGPPR